MLKRCVQSQTRLWTMSRQLLLRSNRNADVPISQ